MPITFIKDNLTLPSDAAVNHPHLIDLAASTPPYSDRSLKLPDAIATMLHNISTNTVDHLANFLDTNHPSLRVIQQFRNTSNTDKFVIAKQGKKVLVGVFTEHIKENVREFDNLVRFDVAGDGSWSVTYMSYRDYFRCNWDDVWAGRTIDVGFGALNMKATPGNDPAGCWNLLPFQLAENIVTNGLFDAQTSQWTVT